MTLKEMLDLYRGAATPQMKEIAAEFQFLSASEQRELLLWMVVDTANNPTKVQHVRPAPTRPDA
jgi:hypothetical protein